MIEMARGSDGRFGIGCGGDTFNTAVYLARAGIDVAYATALGDDPYSDGIVALAAAEGMKTDLMLRVPGRLPGLYLIETDADGRAHVPLLARRGAGARAVRAAGLGPRSPRAMIKAQADLFLRHHAVALFQRRRSAASSRSSRWRASRAPRSRSTATSGRAAGRATCRAPARCSWRRSSASTSRMPTYDDEAVLWGDPSPEATVERLQAFGIGEIVVKNGPNSALVASGGTAANSSRCRRSWCRSTPRRPATASTPPIWRRGSPATARARRPAPRIASPAEVIRHRGAIMPRTAAAMH